MVEINVWGGEGLGKRGKGVGGSKGEKLDKIKKGNKKAGSAR